MPSPLSNAYVIDRKMNHHRPEQAYFVRPLAAGLHEVGIITPLLANGLKEVLAKQRDIEAISKANDISFNKAFNYYINTTLHLPFGKKFFRANQDNFFSVSSYSFCGEDGSFILPLKPSKHPSNINIEFCNDRRVDELFMRKHDDICNMYGFSRKYRIMRDRFFGTAANTQSQKITHPQQRTGSSYVSSQNGTYNFRASYVPTDRGEEIRRGITTICMIGATQYAESYDVPVLYKNLRTGFVENQSMQPGSMVRFTAAYRNFLDAINILQLSSHMKTDKADLNKSHVREAQERLNYGIKKGLWTLD